MRYIMKVRIPIEKGNAEIRDAKFGEKMSKLLSEIKAEAAYFSTINGQRGGYIVVNTDDPSGIPALAEPFFIWLNADVEWFPVMKIEDLQKAGPSIGAAVQKWG